jgi:hypothetical protein
MKQRQIRWKTRPPASEDELDALADSTPVPLPVEYLRLLSESNGGEGELGAQPGWFVLWSAADVPDSNRGCELASNLPGFFGFGTTGSGELLAFDTRKGPPYPVVAIPAMPMEVDEALPLAPSFAAFLDLMGKACDDDPG